MSGRDARDDFPESVKRDLCDRVGGLCSRPGCRVVTKGPRADSPKAKSIGRASHIHAAAPGGPRYDASQTPEQRCSFENGIWLCANHAAEVDADVSRFSAVELRGWKEDAENVAQSMIGRSAAGIGLGAARGLIAIGPDVVAEGRVLRTAFGVWTVALDEFVLGDLTDLRRFADSFPGLPPDDCYLCLQTDGVGRMLVDAPTTDLTSGVVVELHVAAPLPLAEARKQFDANRMPTDLALALSGDEPDLDPTGREVSGADTIAQLLVSHLSTCKGGHCVGGEHGSRVAELGERLGRENLTGIIAIETIRLATVPHEDAFKNELYVPFAFIERVRGVRLLPTNSAAFLKAAITLDVFGVGPNKEFIVPISTSTESLHQPPPLLAPGPLKVDNETSELTEPDETLLTILREGNVWMRLALIARESDMTEPACWAALADLKRRAFVGLQEGGLPRAAKLTETGWTLANSIAVLVPDGRADEWAEGLEPLSLAVVDTVAEQQIRLENSMSKLSHVRATVRKRVDGVDLAMATKGIEKLVASQHLTQSGGVEAHYHVTIRGLLASSWGANSVRVLESTWDLLSTSHSADPSVMRFYWEALRRVGRLPRKAFNLAYVAITLAKLSPGLYTDNVGRWWTVPPELDRVLDHGTLLDYLRRSFPPDTTPAPKLRGAVAAVLVSEPEGGKPEKGAAEGAGGRSLSEVRLFDGTEPPTGASRLLLATFDVPGRITLDSGRRELTGVLSRQLGRVASETELDDALRPLIQRGFLEAHAAFKPEDDEPPFPDMKSTRIKIDGEPDEGEPYYRVTVPSGLRAARLCAGLKNLGRKTPWLLGPSRLDDQVLVSFTLPANTVSSAAHWCCTSHMDDVGRAMEGLLTGGFIEPVREGGKPVRLGEETVHRLTVAGELRAAKVAHELTLVARQVVRLSAASAGAPVATK
jgi:hypothetical protein